MLEYRHEVLRDETGSYAAPGWAGPGADGRNAERDDQ